MHQELVSARLRRRADLLDQSTRIVDGVRMLREDASVRQLSKTERGKVVKAFERYLTTIPEHKRVDRALFYDLRDVVAK